MLDHLRQHVVDLLEPVRIVTLSTCGPAGIQAQVLPGEAVGLLLYVLVPETSEHLYNLEQNSAVVVTTGEWQLRGTGRRIDREDAPAALELLTVRDGGAIVEVIPRRLQVGRADGRGFSETLDIAESTLPPA